MPVGNWPDAAFYPIGLAIYKDDRQGAGTMVCMLIKLDVDS